jgi:molecular chaperone GrpE (heat shock protein)
MCSVNEQLPADVISSAPESEGNIMVQETERKQAGANVRSEMIHDLLPLIDNFEAASRQVCSVPSLPAPFHHRSCFSV